MLNYKMDKTKLYFINSAIFTLTFFVFRIIFNCIIAYYVFRALVLSKVRKANNFSAIHISLIDPKAYHGNDYDCHVLVPLLRQCILV